jgi:hypothetical protein
MFSSVFSARKVNFSLQSRNQLLCHNAQICFVFGGKLWEEIHFSALDVMDYGKGQAIPLQAWTGP